MLYLCTSGYEDFGSKRGGKERTLPALPLAGEYLGHYANRSRERSITGADCSLGAVRSQRSYFARNLVESWNTKHRVFSRMLLQNYRAFCPYRHFDRKPICSRPSQELFLLLTILIVTAKLNLGDAIAISIAYIPLNNFVVIAILVARGSLFRFLLLCL